MRNSQIEQKNREDETEHSRYLSGLLQSITSDESDLRALHCLEGLVEFAHIQGVQHLLATHLKGSSIWKFVPPEVRDSLSIDLKLAAAIEMARGRDIMELADSLEKSGLEMLVLKGGALAYSHYPQPYLRPRCDTDIFFSIRDLPQVRQLMDESGYERIGFVYKNHQFSYVKRNFNGQLINYDVHWRLSNASQFARLLSFDEAMADSVLISGSKNLRALSPIHALFHACIHRLSNRDHDPNRLIWLYDIHLIVERFDAHDWEQFCELAVRTKTEVACMAALDVTRLRLNTEIPKVVIDKLSVMEKETSFVSKVPESILGLIIYDLIELPSNPLRFEMINEWLFPSARYLLDKYNKQGLIWVPILYLKYYSGGLLKLISR